MGRATAAPGLALLMSRRRDSHGPQKTAAQLFLGFVASGFSFLEGCFVVEDLSVKYVIEPPSPATASCNVPKNSHAVGKLSKAKASETTYGCA